MGIIIYSLYVVAYYWLPEALSSSQPAATDPPQTSTTVDWPHVAHCQFIESLPFAQLMILTYLYLLLFYCWFSYFWSATSENKRPCLTFTLFTTFQLLSLWDHYSQHPSTGSYQQLTSEWDLALCWWYLPPNMDNEKVFYPHKKIIRLDGSFNDLQPTPLPL